jgi:hypothetical protein
MQINMLIVSNILTWRECNLCMVLGSQFLRLHVSTMLFGKGTTEGHHRVATLYHLFMKFSFHVRI